MVDRGLHDLLAQLPGIPGEVALVDAEGHVLAATSAWRGRMQPDGAAPLPTCITSPGQQGNFCRAHELAALQQRFAADGHEPGRLLAGLVERVVRLAGASGALVALQEGDGFQVGAAGGTLAALEGQRFAAGALGVAREVLDRGVPQDVELNGAAAGGPLAGVRRLYVEPLAIGGRAFGALLVARDADARLHTLDRHSVDIAARLAENVIANHRLRESETRFRAMADSSPFLIWTSDPAERLDWANRSMLAFTGRTLEEECAHDRWLDTHPDDRATLRPVYARALAARAPFQFEYRLRRWDGAWRWMRDTGVPRYRDDGGFAGFVGSMADITEEREAKERADAVATRFHTVLETATDAILVLDERLDVVFFNRAAEELSGWLRSEVLHRPVDRLLPSEERDRYRGEIERFIAEGRDRALHVLAGQIIGLRRDGTRFTAELSLALGHEGERLMVTVILRDVSARLAAEETLREAEERLQVAEKLTSIADMASATVHDLNSMLMSVQCAADLLAARTGDAHPAEVDMIRAAVEKGTQLTKRLSNVSRQRYQEAQLVEVPVVVDELLPVLRRILGKRHTVEAAASGEVPPTQVVRTDLEQALLNLVTNARDAMPEGGPVRIEMSARDLDEVEAAGAGVRAGTYAAIAVTDAGLGMDEATLARVFEPFFTTKGPARGTGLGLYTVRRFLARSGGGISVRTAPGEGTTFTLLLPAPGTVRRGRD